MIYMTWFQIFYYRNVEIKIVLIWKRIKYNTESKSPEVEGDRNTNTVPEE